MTSDETWRIVDGVPEVRLVSYDADWADDDLDANFRTDVAAYALADPLLTLRNLGASLDIPVGALVRYVLAKWASGGAEALMETGASTIERLADVVDRAEAEDTEAARLEAYDQLRVMVQWLAHGVRDADATYPAGGSDVSG